MADQDQFIGSHPRNDALCAVLQEYLTRLNLPTPQPHGQNVTPNSGQRIFAVEKKSVRPVCT